MGSSWHGKEDAEANMKIVFDVKYWIRRNSREGSPPPGNHSGRPGREGIADVRLPGAVHLLHADGPKNKVERGIGGGKEHELFLILTKFCFLGFEMAHAPSSQWVATHPDQTIQGNHTLPPTSEYEGILFLYTHRQRRLLLCIIIYFSPFPGPFVMHCLGCTISALLSCHSPPPH